MLIAIVKNKQKEKNKVKNGSNPITQEKSILLISFNHLYMNIHGILYKGEVMSFILLSNLEKLYILNEQINFHGSTLTLFFSLKTITFHAQYIYLHIKTMSWNDTVQYSIVINHMWLFKF